MKNQKLTKGTLSLILIVLASTALKAQTGIEKAAQDFTTSASNVKNYLEKGLMVLAFLAAAVGLVTALNKANVEGENASKHYIKWFVAAGIFALAWAAMKTIFA